MPAVVPSNTKRYSSIACPYDSCELAAGSEFRTAILECSRSGKRSTDLGLAHLAIFRRRTILAASLPQAQYGESPIVKVLEPRLTGQTLPITRLVRHDGVQQAS